MERQAICDVLKDLIADTTGETCPDLDENQDLRGGLGLDSVDLFSLVIESQTRFNIKIPSEDLMAVATVGDFLDLVQSKLARNASTVGAA